MTVPWNRLRRDLNKGFETLVWTVRFLADRLRKETGLARTAFEVRRLEDRINEAYRMLGERLYVIRHRADVPDDIELRDTLEEIERLTAEIEETARRLEVMEGRFDDVEPTESVDRTSEDEPPGNPESPSSEADSAGEAGKSNSDA